MVEVITCKSNEFITRGLRPLVINSLLLLVITSTTCDNIHYFLPATWESPISKFILKKNMILYLHCSNITINLTHGQIHTKCPKSKLESKDISLELAQCEKSLVGSNRVVHVWEPHDAAEKKACLMSPHRDLKSLLGWLYSKFSHSEVTIIIITRVFFHYVRHFIFLSLMSVLVYIDIYKHLTKKVLIKFCA